MKHIKIVTYCTWTSIGSILQTFGLKSSLAEQGYDSVVLLDKHENEFVSTKVKSIKSLLSRAFQELIRGKRKSAYRKRMDFIHRAIDVDIYDDYSNLCEKILNDSADVYLAGSDQIWHPDHCNPVFFLDFVKNQKRISYAASMGKTVIAPDKMERFKDLVSNFDCLSVRERHCAEVIGAFTDKDISVNIDPTFLIDVHQWRQLEKEYIIKNPYILLYMIYWHPSCKNQIKELKKKTGLPVYAISSGLSRVYADKYLFDVGVEEFLWLVDHAEYVVTSSFHGAALSTIFNKKFAAVINPASPSRIENLLTALSLPLVDIADLAETTRFDYQTVNRRIREEKEKSIHYLKKAIE